MVGSETIMKVKTPNVRTAAALKAWAKRGTSQERARRTEARSKVALQEWCRDNNWKVMFFEGVSGAPRTGIVDAVMVRIKPAKTDSIEVRLVQLKGGVTGLKATEIARLKKAMEGVSTGWLLAAHDGAVLYLVPDIPRRGEPAA
jgi:hypothetical protein